MINAKPFILTGVLIAGISPARTCFSASADEWIGKAVNAAGSLARGDASGAAQQAVGGTNVPLPHRANLAVGLGNVSFQQPLSPKLNSPYLNAGSTYNAGANYGLNQVPNFSQNVQVSGGNRYLSNTTTLSGNFDRK